MDANINKVDSRGAKTQGAVINYQLPSKDSSENLKATKLSEWGAEPKPYTPLDYGLIRHGSSVDSRVSPSPGTSPTGVLSGEVCSCVDNIDGCRVDDLRISRRRRGRGSWGLRFTVRRRLDGHMVRLLSTVHNTGCGSTVVRALSRSTTVVRALGSDGRRREERTAVRRDVRQFRALVADIKCQHADRNTGRLFREEEDESRTVVQLRTHFHLGNAVGREASSNEVVVVRTVDCTNIDELVTRKQLDQLVSQVLVRGHGVERCCVGFLGAVSDLNGEVRNEARNQIVDLLVRYVVRVEPLRDLKIADENAVDLEVCEEVCQRDAHDGLRADSNLKARVLLLGSVPRKSRTECIRPLEVQFYVPLVVDLIQGLDQEVVVTFDDRKTSGRDDSRAYTRLRVAGIQQIQEFLAQLGVVVGLVRGRRCVDVVVTLHLSTLIERGQNGSEGFVIGGVSDPPLGQRVALS